MYPSAFRYYRAGSVEEAVSLLSELGEEARLLAGGQSLIPLMKLRLASPAALIDLNFVPGLSRIQRENGAIHFGTMARHTEIEASDIATQIPILHDCASGIADMQVRNRGTVGGSLAEADPSGDWGPVLLTLDTQVRCVGPKGERRIPLSEFFCDAYTTALAYDELLQDVIVALPPPKSGGAYLAFKRCAPVYATASAAVQLSMADAYVCKDARIALGCVGLTPIRATEAEAALRGKALTEKAIDTAAEASMRAAQPESDLRGTSEYKRTLVGALVRRAIAIAIRRSRGERVEVSHEYT